MITQLAATGSPTSNLAQGTAAARPATPVTGFYYATDTGELSMANAGLTGWQTISSTSATLFNIGPSGGAGALGFAGGGAGLQKVSAGLWGLTGLTLDIQTAGGGLRVAEGSNAKQGAIAAMTTGSIAVANTSVTANSRIFVCRNAGGTNPGAWYVSAQTAGTGFTATSTNAADTGTGIFQIFEPG